jgi:hypothetical protein
MPFSPFFERFPEIAQVETGSVCVTQAPDPTSLPSANYVFVELFCDEIRCDCRRAYIHAHDATVIQRGDYRPLATISFGWEKESFYRKWASFDLSRQDLEELRGPALARMAAQSSVARELLELFKLLILDEAYRSRLVSHYNIFREDVNSQARLSQKAAAESHRQPVPTRNSRCPCGSGKKFKRCCAGH